MSNSKKYKEYRITEVFQVGNSHSIMKSQIRQQGKIPYVTASADNNAIVDYVEHDHALIEKGNSIMIGGKTTVITYQPYDYFSNDSHNLVLIPKDERGLNETCQLFMVAALKASLGKKYSWGNSISKTKIKKDTVWLPTTKKLVPDWDELILTITPPPSLRWRCRYE